mmetsp:Transcript_9647/g.23941  ORF Transcript_9647/g.23941 Transcript_9647/m.23941 type:complete len:227 (-) Transcript_9647:2019-2699(-)
MPSGPHAKRYTSRALPRSYAAALSASRNVSFSYASLVLAMAMLMALAKMRSYSVLGSPSRSPAPGASTSSIQASSRVTRRIAALAVVVSKLASSMPSPASARAQRMASAPNSLMASCSVLKLPVDLDIFSLLSSRWPLQRMARGHFSGLLGHMAVWLYSAMVRWLPIRSLPDTRRSQGYQNSNSRRMAASVSAGMGQLAGAGWPRKMWSHTSLVMCSGLMAPCVRP